MSMFCDCICPTSATQVLITFRTDGADSGNPPVAMIRRGEFELEFPGPGTLVKACHDFVGWATTPNATDAEFKEGDLAPHTDTSADYYPVWEYVCVDITYYSTGTTVFHTDTVRKNEVYTVISDVPTRTGFTFNGWSRSSDGSAPLLNAGDTFTPTADTPLYGAWTETA